jgi:outer membrane protein assembly factor BamE (lipoprotein component of BamABCDE complex)
MKNNGKYLILMVLLNFSSTHSQVLTLTDKENNTTQTIGLGSGNIKAGDFISDETLSKFKVGATTYEEVISVLGKPKMEKVLSQSGMEIKIIAYSAMDQSNSLNAASFIPIIGSLFQKTKINTKMQNLSMTFDNKTNTLMNIMNSTDGGGEVESKSTLETLKSLSISIGK